MTFVCDSYCHSASVYCFEVFCYYIRHDILCLKTEVCDEDDVGSVIDNL